MKKNRTLSALKRLGSLFMALIMVLSLLPVTAPHAHAAGTVTLTNKAGEVADTFTIGEPIYVETEGYASSEWLSLWYYNGSWESTYRLWWYANDDKMLLWDAVWTDDFAWDGMNMPAGTYYIYYAESDELASFTLVEPDASVTAEKTLTVVQDGNSVSITAVNYSEYSHVSVKNDDGIVVQKFFCLGRNGLTMEYELTPGEYTISMYNDWDEAELADQKTITVEGEKVELLTTDKTEYKFGEAIMVTSQLGNPNWLGLYKQDDTNIVDGGTTSMFWLYPTVGQPVNLLSGEQQRHSEFVAGTYKVLLLDANYGVLASVENIVITTEIDESKTVTVPATCDNDGSVTYYNTDGTVAKVETLTALGHEYENPVFDEENLQHTFTCKNDPTHTKTDNCTWNEGEVTKEPEGDAKGEKTFTCTVCGGKRTEEYSGKEVEREEVKTPATCEEPGVKVVYYTDGTSEEVEIPKLNHAYPETYTYNNDKKTHSRVCGNDASHVETADCSFTSAAVPGGTRYTCSVCGGYYDVLILSTNKTEYALGEPILITVNTDVYDETATDWVGIWEGTNTHTDNVSIYYYYPAAQGWTDFNIYNSAFHQRDDIAQGMHTIRLFTADTYTEITSVTITVGPAVRDESKTVRVEPTCEKDGSITYYLTDGTVEKVVTAEEDPSLKATGHAYPETWTHVEGTETHKKVCGNDETHVLTEDCKWDAGTETKAPTETETGIMLYTCTVCGGTKEEVIPVLSAEVVNEEIVAPTCDEKGYTLVTYSDGSTRKKDYVDALGHDFSGNCTHINGTHTHSQSCQRKDCDATNVEDCTLETDGVLDGNGYLYSCTKCGEWTENVILTDKAVYASGEDIIITMHPNYKLGGTDWIGLYHKGETPSREGVTSIRWNYAGDFKNGMSIFNSSNHDRPEEDPNNFLKAGEYTLFLCANDGYEILARTYITVTTQEDPTKTVRVEPTCDTDGSVTYYNTDGSVSRVVTAAEDETLKAHGHTYGDWAYDGVEKQTHTHTCVCTVCAEPCGHTETGNCEWDEGVETKPATETETGIKTFTCTVCGGTKTQEIPKVGITVTDTETVPATCEEPGYIRTHYSDGTYSDEVIPATGHDYGEWVMNTETKTHSKTCKNDETHVITEDCTLTYQVTGTTVEHTCSVCNYSFTTGLVDTDKKVYGVTDPIMVTAYGSFPGAWVGLYKKGENPDPDAGGVVSLFWAYTDGRVGQPFDLTAVTDGNDSGLRGEKLANGEYVLRFFGDSGYTNILQEIELTVFTDMSGTEFELLFYKGKVREDGYHHRFKLETVDEPSKGEKVTLGVNVLSGEVGTSWVGVFEGKYNLDTDYNGMTPILSRYIADINGKDPFSMNWASKGGFNFYVGDFTVVIFADGGYSYPVKHITFEVYRPIVSETIRKEPTCEAPGLKYVVYEDDGNDQTEDTALVIIPALGHDLEELKCIEGTNTHGQACKRENCDYKFVEDCAFVDGKCSVCGGIEYHIHKLTRVAPVAATCTADGNKEYFTCECGEYFSDADGKNVITDKASVVITAPGHSWSAATCTEPKTCASCKATEGSALGHSWTDATCTEPKTCSVCKTTEGAALDHAYSAWKFNAADKTHTKTCQHDAAHTETNACTFDTGVVVTEPAVGKEGEKKFTCTVCGGSYTEAIPALEAEGVDRVFGATRYDTALEIADQLKENLGISKFNAIVVASGTDFADALSGTYLANQKGAPVLLVRNRAQELTLVKDYIKANLVPGGTVYILGGEKAVPKAMETGLEGFNVKRLGGATRYETNLLILKEAGVKAGEDILICTGKDFPDSLAASAVNKPIVLVKDSLSTSQQQYLNAVKGGKMYIIGGTAAVNARIETALKNYGTTQRLSGATRYYTAVEIAKTFFPNTKVAVVAYGENFPDGMCGGTLAYSMGAPVLLTTNSKSAAAVDYTNANGIHSGAVLGGTKLISDNVVEKAFG